MTDWSTHAADWDADAAVHAYADGAFESLTRLAETIGFELADATACDFGCGTGSLTERLADLCARIDAVDTSSAMLAELATKIERQHWNHVRVLDRLPPTPLGYDLIVCSSVLAFVEDYPAEVQKLTTRLRAGGLFVQWDWELSPDDEEPHGFTATDIRETLENAGLAAVVVDVGFEATVGGDTMRPLMGSGRRPQ